MKKIKVCLFFILIIGFCFKAKANYVNVNKYKDYVDSYLEGEKCSGYDFSPNEVSLIDFSSYMKSNFKIRDHIMLNNGKIFEIVRTNGNCPSIVIKGKDGYKQLPDDCRFVIGSYCVDPNNKEAEGKSFIYEFTNKGIEHLSDTTMMEYDNVDGE